jgi:heat shock protein 5
MARAHQTSLLGFSILALFALLFSVGFLGTAHAQSDQDPLQENYGTGMSSTAYTSPFLHA